MTKRLPPKSRQPWPAFVLVTAVMTATALLSAVVLDYLSARRGETAYIFASAGRGAVRPAAGPAVPAGLPEPGMTPSEKPEAPPPAAPTARTIDEALAAGLAAAGVSEDAVLAFKDAKGRPFVEVEIPAALYASIEPSLDRALKAESIRVVGKKRTESGERAEVLWTLRRAPKQDASLSFLLPAEPPAVAAAGKPAARPGTRGEVALIMDDMGNSLEVLDALIALGRPVTVAVLPYSARAAETARIARENGLEVLLHLPLESLNNHQALPQTEGMIVTTMTEPAIVAAFEASCDRVPFATGTNNHMGSRFTAERDLMRAILRPIKERGLFFVDSRTTARTVALEEARAMGVPAAERDVFLDADEDRGMIRGRLLELFQKARKRGRAVGICHPFPETLEVLRSSFHLVDAYNLEAVPVSKLVR